MSKCVVHIITGLNTGGAERALYNVIHGGLSGRFQIVVISLTDQGRYGAMLSELGLTVHCLGMTRGILSISGLWYLRKILKLYSPDVIQGWMYHGNLLASLASFLVSRPVKVLWNVRQCLYDLQDEKRLTRWVIRLCKVLSVLPAAIVYNSQLSKVHHEQFGFSSIRGLVIPNGFELSHFSRKKDLRAEVCSELSILKNSVVIGHVGRFHPVKDHDCFLHAAVTIAKQYHNIIFLLVGANVDHQNQHLLRLIPLEFRDRFLLLGERGDIHRLYNAMDVFCLSSVSEAFPNVLGEAMSSSLPCITTNVGDAANIVGESGIVVPPQSPEALGRAMRAMLNKSHSERLVLGAAARKRIEEKFSLSNVVGIYASLYDQPLT